MLLTADRAVLCSPFWQSSPNMPVVSIVVVWSSLFIRHNFDRRRFSCKSSVIRHRFVSCCLYVIVLIAGGVFPTLPCVRRFDSHHQMYWLFRPLPCRCSFVYVLTVVAVLSPAVFLFIVLIVAVLTVSWPSTFWPLSVTFRLLSSFIHLFIVSHGFAQICHTIKLRIEYGLHKQMWFKLNRKTTIWY